MSAIDDLPTRSQHDAKLPVSCSVGDHIQCRYRNRFVRGVVTRVGKKYLVLKLETDYQGKNEDWCVGELKSLQFSLIKNLCSVANGA